MRVLVLVIDSFGIGSMPDAADYGDAGAHTALHICEAVGEVRWPELGRLGLGEAARLLGFALPGVDAGEGPVAHYGVMRERSPGKDTTTGHWELAGVVLDAPFHEFPAEPPSFPPELLDPFRKAFGCAVLGNRAASGTEIIARLGEEHLRDGSPIVYTSADSVFQIAAHEAVVPVPRLYQMCEYIRRLCDDLGLRVGRVIARPFAGEAGRFARTGRRKDFSIALPGPCLMDHLRAAGVRTRAVGKIADIFSGQGIDESYPDKGNPACLARTLALLDEPTGGPEFIFVNLVDTDMIFGHRRDPDGYHEAVSAIDGMLPALEARLAPGDVLVVTADHGCDPTWRGTDHTREHVPLLTYRRDRGEPARSLGVRNSFADLAASIARAFGAAPPSHGEPFSL